MMGRKLFSIFLFFLLVLLICVFPSTNSKYESVITSNGKSEVAIYLLDTTYSVTEIKLTDLQPSVDPYVYSFSVSNNNGVDRTETALEYTLSLRTTTNLPLQYELYLDENYQDASATNLFDTSELMLDEDGMYFLKVSIPKRTFGYTQNEIDNYTLVIYFPYQYRDYNYQNMIESIELIVDSKQIIPTS